MVGEAGVGEVVGLERLGIGVVETKFFGFCHVLTRLRLSQAPHPLRSPVP